MNTIECNKGCCLLKILQKAKHENNHNYPFEKRKAGVFVSCGEKVLLTQSYNNCWGIPKGQMEPYDLDTKICAERELKEETGLEITLNDHDLYKIILNNYYIYKINIDNMNIINLENLPNLDSTGIGWVNIECAFDLNINFLTRKILMNLNG